jgi:hypothetical protein
MFNTEEAKEFSIESAILLNNIRFWLRKNKANQKNIFEGKVWTYNSAEAFTILFPYMSRTTIWRRLDELFKAGKILKGNFNDDKRDKTLWFCINEPEFTNLSKMDNSKSQNEISIVQDEINIVQNEPPLPYIKPNINTDNNTPISPKQKTASDYVRGFVLESRTRPDDGKLTLLNDEAVSTIKRFEHYYYKEKKRNMSLTDLVFTEAFEVELEYFGQKYHIKSIIEDVNHEDFNPVVFERTLAAAKKMNELGFECFEFYFSYLNIRATNVFRKYFNN